MQELRMMERVCDSLSLKPVLRSWEPDLPSDPMKIAEIAPFVPEPVREEVLISTRYSS